MIKARIEQVIARFSSSHERTRKAQFNILAGLFLKGGGIVISFLLVPLTLDYLSKETYGTWLTISSLILMLTFFDIGIGNGLRNKFSEAVANHDTERARSYVSTAYVLFGGLQLVLIGIFVIIYRWIPWQHVFNTTLSESLLQQTMLILTISMALKLVLDILTFILFALQESGLAGFLGFLSNFLILAGTYWLSKVSTENMLYLTILTAASPILVLLVGSLFFFNGRLNAYRPTWSCVNRFYARDLLSLGYQFFIIQLAGIVLFYSDNLIITQLFGSTAVIPYNITYRYFNAVTTVFAIILGPFWSAFTEAYIKQDYNWMHLTLQRLQRLWGGIVLLVLIMIFISERVYKLWIGSRIEIPLPLSVSMGIFVIIICWNSAMVIVTNGLGKVKLQLYYSLWAAIINIPLAIFFGKYLELGIKGVAIASSLSLLAGTFLGTIQARKLINQTASGLWDK